LMYDFNIWPAIKLFVLGGGLCILLAAIITIKWQISAHLMGIGGLVGMLISFAYFLQMPLLVVISGILIVAGLVGFARLQLQAHKPSQVYAGFLSGVFLILILFTLAQQFKLL
jgi:membrane-associated phospholipid phosphatase